MPMVWDSAKSKWCYPLANEPSFDDKREAEHRSAVLNGTAATNIDYFNRDAILMAHGCGYAD